MGTGATAAKEQEAARLRAMATSQKSVSKTLDQACSPRPPTRTRTLRLPLTLTLTPDPTPNPYPYPNS